MTEAEIEAMVAKLEASMGTKRYFLRGAWASAEWTEVSRQEWIDAERAAGFYPKSGHGEATGGFSGHGVSGKYTLNNEAA